MKKARSASWSLRLAKMGYRIGGGRAALHGYYFKILTKQGLAAPGGILII